MAQGVEALQAIQQSVSGIQQSAAQMAVNQNDLCVTMISLANAYIEVHKKEHPEVEKFHLSQRSSQ